MKKILIVTPEIEGPIRNGGIATAFTALATTLAKHNFDVTILYTLNSYTAPQALGFKDWVYIYEKLGIRLVSTDLNTGMQIDVPHFRKKSYAIYRWLKDNDVYDTVIGSEYHADLYYSLLSKKAGHLFEKTKFIINTHGPCAWTDEGNYQLPSDQERLELYYMEKKTIEMADELISPSQFLFDWMLNRNWTLPENQKVILNLPPSKRFNKTASAPAKSTDKNGSKVELVFFGRLEFRKGFDIFLRALKLLNKEDKELISQVTFLGRDVSLGDINASTYIHEQTEGLNIPVKLITDYDRTQANEHIKQDNKLVIIASRTENSPYTVYECLINNVNFLSSNVGGIPELIPNDSRHEILFEPKPADLCDKIRIRLDKLDCQPGLAKLDEEIEAAWLTAVDEDWNSQFVTIDRDNAPLVSVCITHFQRFHLLQQAIASIQEQTYKNIELVVVDDGSKDILSNQYFDLIEDSFKAKNWKLIRSSNNYLGAARNVAASHATGEYLIFMDDDDVAQPYEVEYFVKAALNSKADIITAMNAYHFSQDYPIPSLKPTACWLPLGADLNIGGFANCFGCANALVKKEAFDKLGGFTEDYGIGYEDWEFFLNATLKGFKLHLLPELVLWYRISDTGMLRSGNKDRNNFRSYRPFLEENVEYNYAIGLIPSYMKKINELQDKNHWLSNRNHWLESQINRTPPAHNPSAQLTLSNRVKLFYKRGQNYIERQREEYPNNSGKVALQVTKRVIRYSGEKFIKKPILKVKRLIK